MHTEDKKCLENRSNHNKKVIYYMMLEVKEDNEEGLNRRINTYVKNMKEYKWKLCGYTYIKDKKYEKN